MLKTIALKRSTVLGELTVWFGPKAMKFIEDLEKYHHGIRRYYNAEIYANRQLDKFLSGGKLDADVEVLNQIDKVPDRGYRFSISLVMDSCPKCKGTQIGSEYKPETELHYAHCFTCGHSWDGYEPSEEAKEWLDPNRKKRSECEPDEDDELHSEFPPSRTVYKERKGAFEPKGTMPVEGDYVTYIEENNKEHHSRQVGQITEDIAYTEDRFMYDLLGFKEGKFRVLKRKVENDLYEPVGTRPVIGDEVCWPWSDKMPHSWTVEEVLRNGYVRGPSRERPELGVHHTLLEDFSRPDGEGWGVARVLKRKSQKGLLEAFAAESGGSHQRIRIGDCFFVKRLDSCWQGSCERYHKLNVECKPYAPVALAIAEEWENEIREQGLLQ